MNKQEAIEKIKKEKSPFSSWEGLTRNNALDDALAIVRKIDEPEKPVVPRCVADWYEEHKDNFEYSVQCLCVHGCEPIRQIDTWFDNDDNKPIETLVMMHKFGYEIEKEKLYTVEIPNPNHEERPILFKERDGKVHIIFSNVSWWGTVKNAQLTESEIKEDFEWAWQFAEEVEE